MDNLDTLTDTKNSVSGNSTHPDESQNRSEFRQTEPNSGKKFSQEDVNRIVQDRLAKEKAKLDGLLADREKALQDREFNLYALEKLKQTGLPESVFDALNASDRESFDKSVDLIASILNSGAPLTARNGGAGFGSLKASDGGDDIRRAMGL